MLTNTDGQSEQVSTNGSTPVAISEAPDTEELNNDEALAAVERVRPVVRRSVARLKSIQRHLRELGVLEWAPILVSVVGVYFLVQQIAQTNEALRQASDANALARTSFAEAQRAYVTVNDLEVKPVRDAQGAIMSWALTPIIVNAGNTPTKNMWWTGTSDDTRGMFVPAVTVNGKTIGPYVTDGPLGPNVMTFERISAATRNRLSLGPRQEARPVGLLFPLPVRYIEQLRNNLSVKIFVHGVLIYEDFLTDVVHVTRYCFSLWHNARVTGDAIGASQCGATYNCSDEECEDYQRLRTLVGTEGFINGYPR